MLPEQNGVFGPRVKETLFEPDNVYLMASKSGKRTLEVMQSWGGVFPFNWYKIVMGIE